MSRRSLRIAHTSDVHLDGKGSTGATSEFRNVAEFGFAQVVNTTIQEECDLLLVVGDLYDNDRIRQDDVDFVRSQLSRLSVPVIMIPGNHDVYMKNSLWQRLDHSDFGTNIHSIDSAVGVVLAFPELDLKVWGKAMEEHSPDNKPLDGVVQRTDDTWWIGLAHGQMAATRTSGTSSLITSEEVEASDYDYFALGHVHVWDTFKCGNTIACYPGSPVEAYASSKGGFVAVISLDEEDGVQIEKTKLDAPRLKPRQSARPTFLVPGV